MHEQLELIERRLRRVLNSRIRPAEILERAKVRAGAQQTPERHLGLAAARAGSFSPIASGEAWGSPWQTTWFELSGTIPGSWHDHAVELVIDLGFRGGGPGFQAEGLLYDENGTILKGIAPRNAACSLGPDAPGREHRWYLEAAANPSITPIEPAGTPLGDPETAGTAPLYRFGGAELVAIDTEVRALAHDLAVVLDVAACLPADDQRRADLIGAAQRAVDRIDPSDVAPGATAARGLLAPVLATPAPPGAHRLSAIGHAHIDSAWLWPLEETVRKCARTMANVLELMERDDAFSFACSQAQQYAWVKTHYPELFERVRAKVAAGRFIPVGGMWVESDTNLPGGESLVRQLLYGQRFFLEEFGITCREIWLPDCFGFSGALPQIARLAGCDRFLTQKMSWNETNRFPHHSFMWEGIDGSRLFAHFPPVDTYNAELSAAELTHAARSFSDKLGARRSLVPFGYGDGGGGPTREMLERARRLGDLAGMPRLVLEPVAEFFDAAIAEYEEPPVWSGELPLELHRGTFSSQAEIKAQLRHVEHLLRTYEAWSASAALVSGRPYPYEELEQSWKTLCLRQFHDIAPGSSIAQVNIEAVATLRDLGARLGLRIAETLESLAGTGTRPLLANAAPVPLAHLAPLSIGVPAAGGGADVGVEEREGQVILDNGLLRVRIDATGAIDSLVDLEHDRELVAPGQRAAQLQLHPDLPREWDAWDLDSSYRNVTEALAQPAEVSIESRDGTASVLTQRTFRHSSALVRFSLAPGARRIDLAVDVDWHEHDHCLKLAFPLDLATPAEVAEIQFGHLRRPTHVNTPWDAAHFERCAQRFVHLPEGDYGATLANDSTFGYDVARRPRNGGGFTTTLRATLLRSPRYPDPRADAGRHRFVFALAPGTSLRQAIAEGYRANQAPISFHGDREVPAIVASTNPGVLIETLKLAEDRSGDLIVRCYEAEGARARTTLVIGAPLSFAGVVDLLERPIHPLEVDGQAIEYSLRPFEIVTFRLKLATS